MSDRPMNADADGQGDPGVPWAVGSAQAEPEPDWVAEIRARRKARGDRLRQIFNTFDEEKGTDQ